MIERYEIWIDGIFQDSVSNSNMVGICIGEWLLRHDEDISSVTITIKIIRNSPLS